MSQDRIPACSSGATAAPADDAAERSGLYALLAQGFRHPDDEVVAFLSRCAGAAPVAEGEMAECLARLLGIVRSSEPDRMRAEHMRVFDPVTGPFPYEGEYSGLKDFHKAHLLADISGFYNAFGVAPHGDRPDHISTELEFMHLLALKEHHALHHAGPEQVEICRDAQATFLRDHLLKWVDDFAEQMADRARGREAAFHTELVNLLRLLIEAEREGLT